MKQTSAFTLEQKLRTYAASGALPMHMPGHKRNSAVFDMTALQDIDITEIHGFDDLHDPAGILQESQSAAAALYGADRSFYLVNGSTAGILAGISACVKPGDRLLMARNCHLSVYHAVILNALRPDYLWPPVDPAFGIAGSMEPRRIEQALAAAKQEDDPYAAVVLTSPTYEGVLSDVRQIARICHAYGVPLVVDEAHGAHLSVKSTDAAAGCLVNDSMETQPMGAAAEKQDAEGACFPYSAIALGADCVIQSLHKTLPAPTQTGILHCRSGIIDTENVKRMLDVYQTSSPSYIFLCGIENALRYRSDAGWDAEWLGNLKHFYVRTEDLKALRIVPPGPGAVCFDREPSKIVISAAGTVHTGNELMTVLREKYKIEAEMAAGSYVIAMTGAGDTKDTLERLAAALEAIDAAWSGSGKTSGSGIPEKESGQGRTGEDQNEKNKTLVQKTTAVPRMNRSMIPAEAFYRDSEPVDLRAAEGKISGGIVTIYPPGIPVTAPGEEITGEIIARITAALREGLHVTGLSAADGEPAVRIIRD